MIAKYKSLQSNLSYMTCQGNSEIWPTKLDLQLPVQSVPITTKVVSSNPVHGEVYSIQNYVIKFVNDL